MKKIKIVSILSIAIFLLSACVSTRKYNEALSSKAELEKKYNASLSENNSLRDANNHLLSTNSSLQLAAADEKNALREREKALSAEEREMNNMKSLVNEEKQAIINLKQEVCSALKCFTPDELQINIRDGKLYVSMSDKLLFPSGSDIVNSRGKEAIAELTKVLSNSGLEMAVEGHTDTVPIHNIRNKDNWDLSVHRATSVARIFIKDGIPPQRIIASGEGKYHALASNQTEQGRQENRRTDIVLSPKLDKLWALTEQPAITSSLNKK